MLPNQGKTGQTIAFKPTSHKIMIMKEAVNIKDLKNCSTPEELYSVIEKYLNQPKDTALSSQDLEVTYQEARSTVIRFRKVYEGLPTLPAYNNNITAGLQEIMEWCIAAIDVVHNMVLDLDSAVIEETIGLLIKLKELPGFGFPTINEHLWNKAKERAQRIVDKYRANISKRKACRRLSSSIYFRRTRFLYTAEIISSLAEVAGRKDGDPTMRSYPLVDNSITSSPSIKQVEEALTEMDFYKAVEKIYRLIDKTYTDGLVKLEQNIGKIIDRVNHLDSTQTGKLLNTYEKLSGLKLKDRFDRIGRAYSIDSIVESALFGTSADLFFVRESRESLVDSLVGTLKEISQAAITDLAPEKPPERKQKASSICQMIWTWVKRIPRWIYFLICFLASLLTCIYILWWLCTTFWKT